MRRPLLLASLLLVQAATVVDPAPLLLSNEHPLTLLWEASLLSGRHAATLPADLLPFVPAWRPIVRLLCRYRLRTPPVFDLPLLSGLALPDSVPLDRVLPDRVLPSRILPLRVLPDRVLPGRVLPGCVLPGRVLPVLRLPLPIRLPLPVHVLLLRTLLLCFLLPAALLLLRLPLLLISVLLLCSLRLLFALRLRRSFLFLLRALLRSRFGFAFGLLVGLGRRFSRLPMLRPHRDCGPKKQQQSCRSDDSNSRLHLSTLLFSVQLVQ